MNVLGTGLSGLVGSRVVELLSPEFTFENLSLETGVDITEKASVDSYFSRSDAPWVFHFAAYTDVQGAEKNQDLAWKVNVLATEHIAINCRKMGKHLLYIDTDYVFDGKKSGYSETDKPNPQWQYAKTKYAGAKRVEDLGDLGLVIRISTPYRAHPVGKKDFVHKMLELMKSGHAVTAAKDQIFTPTFIDDIALAVRKLISVNAHGIYHVVGSALSPYDAALSLAEVFGYDKKLVMPGAFEAIFRGKAQPPQYAALKNDKIQALGIHMRSFQEGIQEVKRQEEH